jgi:hypothetical protein
MIEGLALLMQDSQIASPQQELIDIDGYKGLLQLQPDSGQGDVKMILGKETLVTITARNFPDSRRARVALLDYVDAVFASEIPRIAGDKE